MTRTYYYEVTEDHTRAVRRWVAPVGSSSPLGGGGRNGVIPAIIDDYLTTHGDMSAPELIDKINDRHDLKPDSIRAALRRMVGNGRIRRIKHWYGLDTYTTGEWYE